MESRAIPFRRVKTEVLLERQRILSRVSSSLFQFAASTKRLSLLLSYRPTIRPTFFDTPSPPFSQEKEIILGQNQFMLHSLKNFPGDFHTYWVLVPALCLFPEMMHSLHLGTGVRYYRIVLCGFLPGQKPDIRTQVFSPASQASYLALHCRYQLLARPRGGLFVSRCVSMGP